MEGGDRLLDVRENQSFLEVRSESHSMKQGFAMSHLEPGFVEVEGHLFEGFAESFGLVPNQDGAGLKELLKLLIGECD